MNHEESLDEVETHDQEKFVAKEKSISACLVLSDTQFCLITMEEAIFSGTVIYSDKETNVPPDLLLPPEFEEAKAIFKFTAEQENDLREAFNLLDYSGEGKIKTEDFRVAIKALGYEPTKEELQNMISAVDRGDTGKLSFENFQTAIMRKVMSQDSDGDIMKSFRLFDMDDSGFINLENLKRVTQILGLHLSDEEIEEMIDDADKDFDGLVSADEFMKMIKNIVNIVTP